jgi:CTP synthase (UTP-ammonia lyase)
LAVFFGHYLNLPMERNSALFPSFPAAGSPLEFRILSAKVHIGIVGDFDLAKRSHPATNAALEHATKFLGLSMDLLWMPTAKLERSLDGLQGRDGIFCAAGSPYVSMSGALSAIRFARENRRPFLGTCGGFQHAIIEYARNVLGNADADTAETNPDGTQLIINRLSCSLAGKTQEILLYPDSRLREIMGRDQITENYICNFGLNDRFRGDLERAGVRVGGVSSEGEVRALEWPEHPFFIGTLFQPQLSSQEGAPHPLIVEFIRAAERFAASRPPAAH